MKNRHRGNTLVIVAAMLGVGMIAALVGGVRLFADEDTRAVSVFATLPKAVVRLPFIGMLPQAELTEPRVPQRLEGTPDVILDVAAAFAVTTQGEVLFAQNENSVLPIASITKLLTALTALNRLEPDASIVITPEAIAEEGDLGGLYVNETLSLYDALAAMLLPSSNDAAVAIAQAALGDTPPFVEAMNAEAKVLGLAAPNFNNVHGLSPPGNFTSARGVATMMVAALEHPLLSEIIRQERIEAVSEEGIEHTFTHRGNGLMSFPGALGAKTGYTDESGGTLVFAFRPDLTSDRVVVTVVLGSADRSADTEALAQWIRGVYTFPPATQIVATP